MVDGGWNWVRSLYWYCTVQWQKKGNLEWMGRGWRSSRYRPLGWRYFLVSMDRGFPPLAVMDRRCTPKRGRRTVTLQSCSVALSLTFTCYQLHNITST